MTARHAGGAGGALLAEAPTGLSRSRVAAGLAATGLGLPLVTAALVALRDSLARESGLLIYMLMVAAVAVTGGVVPALLAASGAFLLANWFLTPPFNTFEIRDRSQFVDLVVFLLGALLVSITVELGARRRATAERHRLEAELTSRLGSVEMSTAPVTYVLEQVRALFGMTSVALGSDTQGRLCWVGPAPSGEPRITVPAGTGLELTAYGPELFAADRRLLRVLATSAGHAWDRERLASEAARARELAETDRVRSALLAAVSHDLRTPIAGTKAAVSGLRQPGGAWEPGEEAELLAAIESGADHLTALVDNLLAMTRLQAGVVSVHLQAVALDEVVGRALLSTGSAGVAVDVPEDLPAALADPGLLERVVANLVDNAVRWGGPGRPVEITAEPAGAVLRLDVIDHGKGVPRDRWDDMFVPFRRLGDSTPGGGAGLGLGLAIVRGFVEAMGGEVAPRQTPGGGLTISVTVPVAS